MRHVREILPETLGGERLDRLVALLADVSRTTASSLVEAGEVSVDGAVATRRAERVPAGAVVELDVPAPAPDPVTGPEHEVVVDVVYEDDHVIVVDKAPGVVVHPGAGNDSGTLAAGLVARYPELAGVGDPVRPGIVHRLDRDTSGLLVVARSEPARQRLSTDLADRTVVRRYRCAVWGSVTEPRGLIDAAIGRSTRDPTRMAVVVGGRPARTGYEVLTRFTTPIAATELRCRLETGRTHQIRVHLQRLGHPVLGDTRYGGARSSFPVGRQFLHAEHLAFAHPMTGVPLAFDSDLPADLVAVLARLG